MADSDILQQVHSAGGQLRDSLGALGNLEQLLKTVKVAPKAIASVIPDVLESCGPLLASTERFSDALSHSLTPTPEELTPYVTARVVELESELNKHRRGSITAARRLSLERVVTRLSRDLRAALPLFDLLEEVLSRRAIPLDVLDLILQSRSGDQPTPLGATIQSVTVDATSEHIEALVNPRAVVTLLSLAVAKVAKSGGTQPSVFIGSVEQRRVVLRVGTRMAMGTAINIVTPRLIGPSLETASAAARVMKATLQASDDGSEVTLTMPLNPDSSLPPAPP